MLKRCACWGALLVERFDRFNARLSTFHYNKKIPTKVVEMI